MPENFSLPSSVIDSEEENSPYGFNRGFMQSKMSFSDSEPWDKEDAEEDDDRTPSFSTPTKEVAKPTNLMSKMFNAQFKKVQDEELKVQKKEQSKIDEIEKLKADLEREKQDVHVMKLKFARETKGKCHLETSLDISQTFK